MKWEKEPTELAIELRKRRAAFWRAVWPVAIGVFIGQIMFAALTYVVLTTWLDSAL